MDELGVLARPLERGAGDTAGGEKTAIVLLTAFGCIPRWSRGGKAMLSSGLEDVGANEEAGWIFSLDLGTATSHTAAARLRLWSTIPRLSIPQQHHGTVPSIRSQQLRSSRGVGRSRRKASCGIG